MECEIFWSKLNPCSPGAGRPRRLLEAMTGGGAPREEPDAWVLVHGEHLHYRYSRGFGWKSNPKFRTRGVFFWSWLWRTTSSLVPIDGSLGLHLSDIKYFVALKSVFFFPSHQHFGQVNQVDHLFVWLLNLNEAVFLSFFFFFFVFDLYG